jgi:hypothetical protein
MPKGTDLSVHSAEDLARLAHSLNNRPRKTLGFMKPSEKLAEFLAHTARTRRVTYDRLMDVLGHPCRGRGIGRLDPAGDLAWKLLRSTANIDWDHTSRLADIPVDENVARALWLGDWDEWQEILSDDPDDDS